VAKTVDFIIADIFDYIAKTLIILPRCLVSELNSRIWIQHCCRNYPFHDERFEDGLDHFKVFRVD